MKKKAKRRKQRRPPPDYARVEVRVDSRTYLIEVDPLSIQLSVTLPLNLRADSSVPTLIERTGGEVVLRGRPLSVRTGYG